MLGEVELKVLGPRPRVVKCGNKLVAKGFKGLLANVLSRGCHSTHGGVACTLYSWAHDYNVKVGSGGDTPTTPDMTDLVSPYTASPSSKSLGFIEDEALPGCGIVVEATYDYGAVVGTVNEVGLYMKPPDRYTCGWRAYEETYNPPLTLIARVCSADGEFTPIDVASDESLTVTWRIMFKAL